MWAVLPFKDLAGAKQRLGRVLDTFERQRLFRTMVEDVLEALVGVATLDGVMVVSRDPAAAALADRYGARVFREAENRGHTAAVSAAAIELSGAGADGMIQVPGDVPLVTPAEIESVLEAHGEAPAVTFVPSRDRRGSNCVVCSPPVVMPLEFGDNSFYPHLKSARSRGLRPKVVALPGLGLDIDTPDDLMELLRRPTASRTQCYLSESGIAARLIGDDNQSDSDP